MTAGTEIRTVTNPADFDAVRALCWAYRDFLLDLGGKTRAVVEHFYPEDKYRQVLASFETIHVPPGGICRLALVNGQPVGCGMVQDLGDGSAEIKRVYLTDAARGLGLGRRLCENLIDDCRSMGYRRILLDTGRPLKVAQALYLDLGFVQRGPYQPVADMVLDVMVFFEKDLQP